METRTFLNTTLSCYSPVKKLLIEYAQTSKLSLKAPASLGIATANRVWRLIGRNHLHLGIAGAAVSFLGCLLSFDSAMYAGAFVALLTLNPSLSKKGGESC